MARLALLVSLSWLVSIGASVARAQDAASGLAVPPPPGAYTAPGTPSAPAHHVAPPADEVVAPLLAAAEQDLAAGRARLALARATLVSGVLPEDRPLRIRADGLRLLARQRLSGEPSELPIDEVLAPLVAQAELDLRAHRTLAAVQRLELALTWLPMGSPLRGRAERLRQVAHRSMGVSVSQPPVPGPYAPSGPLYGHGRAPLPPMPPPDPDRRGGAEMVELYITAAGLGALTGGFIPFVASDQTAGSVTYTLTIIGGAGLFAVGVATLDLTGALRTGMAPTISSSIRFGFINGMLSSGLASQAGLNDAGASVGLIWGSTAIGAVVGLGVAFGVRPRVPEQRLVESVGLWGGGLGTSIAMITEYQDLGVGLALSLVGLDVGLAAGLAAIAAGARMPIGRTLFLDLGFLAGYGVGIAAPLAYHFLSRTDIEPAALGAGSLIGSVGGWLLLLLLTDGMGEPDAGDAPPEPLYSLGIAPVEGGGLVSFSGLL